MLSAVTSSENAPSSWATPRSVVSIDDGVPSETAASAMPVPAGSQSRTTAPLASSVAETTLPSTSASKISPVSGSSHQHVSRPSPTVRLTPVAASTDVLRTYASSPPVGNVRRPKRMSAFSS
ncbi:hypothetical protein ACFPRL_19150 [Pseudoclavibacter helvolus]